MAHAQIPAPTPTPTPAPVKEQHMCKRACNEIMEDDPKAHRESNPLLIPMLCGWERQIIKTKPLSKLLVMYKAPCGRRFRNIHEVDRFLLETDCNLTIDLFCIDPFLHTDKEFVPVKICCGIKDLSYGKEMVPISCVNGIEYQYPDYVEYSNQRTPRHDVTINLDADFLVCCDCTDGCRKKSECACIQQTIEASGVTTGGRPDPSAGYQDRRLEKPLLTGIYECNQRCNCNSRCHNRVAQNGLALRLQVFKTEHRGWGLRCLDDIPCGGFLCIYAGKLLTEQGANEDGQTYGDEYLTDLDYMEVVERHKEGYESDVPDCNKNDKEKEDGEQCYVMDAKSMGNIGRYLNHSCSPNVFVQNVFVDTHDLRFPWVAFFAGKYIRQGTELTWDYNYKVGSVPGKILYCYCGSSKCRERLL